ncbi:hypothetical protein [Gordonia aichiensis]|nr:hypothetical protein [Gordonia aichiensis]
MLIENIIYTITSGAVSPEQAHEMVVNGLNAIEPALNFLYSIGGVNIH